VVIEKEKYNVFTIEQDNVVEHPGIMDMPISGTMMYSSYDESYAAIFSNKTCRLIDINAKNVIDMRNATLTLNAW